MYARERLRESLTVQWRLGQLACQTFHVVFMLAAPLTR